MIVHQLTEDQLEKDAGSQGGDDQPGTVRKAVALDQAFADALQSQLSEWATDEDDEAYRGL